MLRVGLAGFTGFHPAVVRDKGLSARAGHDPILRDLLGVPGAAPGIDRGLWLVQPAAVADDQGVSLVFDVAADGRRHDDHPAGGVRLTDRQKPILSRLFPLSGFPPPSPPPPPFIQKYMMTCYVFLRKSQKSR